MKTVLLVEDNEDDAFLMNRALSHSGMEFQVQVATDGKEALNYLGGTGRYADRDQYPFPCLVFLDLKLPYVHGFDVLTWIRQRFAPDHLPVAILTSSPEERDRQRARELGANEYLVKPPTREMVRDAMHYCFRTESKSAPA
jgi:CheY-like chemotaxis protein